MKFFLLLSFASLIIFSQKTRAQNQPSAEAEAFFNKAMNQINSRHILWIKNTARDMNTKNMAADSAMAKAKVYGVLGSMNGQDIEAIAFLVLMQAYKSSQEDLKGIIARVKAINEQKKSLRAAIESLNHNQYVSRARLDSVKKISLNTEAIKNNNRLSQPVKNPGTNPTNIKNSNTSATKSEIDATKDRLKSDLDSMNEMDENESLRLQKNIDRLSKMMSSLSNLLKKISQTADGITQNLK